MIGLLSLALYTPVAIAILWSVLRSLNEEFVSGTRFYLWAAAACAVIPATIGYLQLAAAAPSDIFAGIYVFAGLANGVLGLLTVVVLWFMRPKKNHRTVAQEPTQRSK